MINLETPRKYRTFIDQANQVANEFLRANSRKYDRAEHTYPKELDTLAALIDGMADSGAGSGAGATGVRRDPEDHEAGKVQNGSNMSSVLSIIEMCWGCTGLLLSMPRQGLGNSAIASVATDEQLEKFAGTWAAMAITEAAFGSDSSQVSTTATKDGDDYILNGEKIFVTSGERADSVVVWATLDKKKGRAAIKSFVVPKSLPGIRVERLEHKLGIRASDTAVIVLDNCRVPAANILGAEQIEEGKGFAGVMATFDNTRPLVAGMAVGVARAALERLRELIESAGVAIDYDSPLASQLNIVAEYISMEADYEAALLLTLEAAWMADNQLTNTLEASMAKAKAGRVANAITLKCVELAGTLGYSEEELLEKWSRDSKILDIFEGTQQIQQLIVARRVLALTSAELK
jgi:acyl-CoA dehydrogenase